MSNFSINNLRLAIKTIINLWVPIVVLSGLVDWNSETTAIIMAASVGTVDALFRVFNVGDNSDASE